MDLLAEITSDAVLEQAYRWLCERRENYSHNDDVWTPRWRWREIKAEMRAELLAGTYRFAPVQRYSDSEDNVEVWSSRDCLVLKAMALVLTRHLAPRLPSTCHHLVGNGGAKAAVRSVARQLRGNVFVFRSDVKSYYASIDHEILFAQLQHFISDARLLDLLWQYMRRTGYEDARYSDMEQGISLGCALSPLMGAVYLKLMDERMAETGLFYARFMDDWVVLAPTRWKLRAAVRCVKQSLAELKVQQHPDKTFVGRICQGFDFLGYRFSPTGVVGVAKQTLQRCVERMNRLYEQGADAIRIGEYVRRWLFWASSGLGSPGLRTDEAAVSGWTPPRVQPQRNMPGPSC